MVRRGEICLLMKLVFNVFGTHKLTRDIYAAIGVDNLLIFNHKSRLIMSFYARKHIIPKV